MSPLLLGGALVFAQAPDDPPPPPEVEVVMAAPTDAEWEARVADLEARLAVAEARIAELETDALAPLPGLAPTVAIGGEPIFVAAGERVPEAVAFGAPVTVEGQVQGDAVSFGGDVTVRSGAHVTGDAVSFGGRVHVLPGGRVDGDRVSYSGTMARTSAGRSPERPSWLRDLARRLVMIFGFAGAGVMVVGMFPKHVDGVSRTLAAHPLRSGLLGVVFSLLAGVMALLLTLTIIGAPVAAVIVGGLGVAGMLGFVASCQAFGDRLPMADVGARRWLAFLLGVAAVGFLGLLPLIGQVSLAAVGLAGLGAALHTRFGTQPQA